MSDQVFGADPFSFCHEVASGRNTLCDDDACRGTSQNTDLDNHCTLNPSSRPLQCPGEMFPYAIQQTSFSMDSKPIEYSDFAPEQCDINYGALTQHASASSTPICPSLEPDIYGFDEVRRAFLGYPYVSSGYEPQRHYDFFPPLQSPFTSGSNASHDSPDLVDSMSPPSATAQSVSPLSRDHVPLYCDHQKNSPPIDQKFERFEYDSDNEDESLSHEPYAKLIYRALMQAPGHRMVLRDIYEWFQKHTCKPKESGTNGWQNSIRHNLSMNQVCESLFSRKVLLN